MMDLQNVHGILDHREAVQIRVDHDIGDIAMDEHFAGQQIDELGSWHAAIGTANPEVAGRLLFSEALKEGRVLSGHACSPGLVICQK
jgi:hypothetical protein